MKKLLLVLLKVVQSLSININYIGTQFKTIQSQLAKRGEKPYTSPLDCVVCSVVVLCLELLETSFSPEFKLTLALAMCMTSAS